MFSAQLAFACRQQFGDNPSTPAPVGDKKAKIAGSSARPYAVWKKLLDGPLAQIAKKCSSDLDVNSGHRDCAGNSRVGGKSKSQHLIGNAADIKFCKGKSLKQMFDFAAEAGCGGIGCYPTFIQCDIGPKRQWGKCPGARKSPDPGNEPQPGGEQSPGDQAYDSKTPPENGASEVTGGSPSGSPSSGASSAPQASSPGRAQYPVPYGTAPTPPSPRGSPQSEDDEESEDQRPVAVESGKTIKDESKITKQGDGFTAPTFAGPGFAVPQTQFGQNGSGADAFASPKLDSNAPPANGKAGGVGGGLGGGDSSGGGGKYNARVVGGHRSNGMYAAGPGGSGGGGGGGSAAQNEAISTFKDSKNLGGPKFDLSGSEADAAVKNMAQDFGLNAGPEAARDIASDTGLDGVGSKYGPSVFELTHSVHERCARAHCVTSGGN